MDRQVSCMTVAAAGFENGSPAQERQLKQESFTADQYHLLQHPKHSIAFNHTQAHEAHSLHAGRLPVFLHPTISLPERLLPWALLPPVFLIASGSSSGHRSSTAHRPAGGSSHRP